MRIIVPSLVVMSVVGGVFAANPLAKLTMIHTECVEKMCYMDLQFDRDQVNPTLKQVFDAKSNTLKISLGGIEMDGNPSIVGKLKGPVLDLRADVKAGSQTDLLLSVAPEIKSGFKKISKKSSKVYRFELPLQVASAQSSMTMTWGAVAVQNPNKTNKAKSEKQKPAGWTRATDSAAWKQFVNLETSSKAQQSKSFSIVASPRLMVVDQSALMYKSPDQKSSVIAKAEFGKTALLMERKQGWFLVKTADHEGWVPSASLVFPDALNPTLLKTWDSQSPAIQKVRNQWTPVLSTSQSPALVKAKKFVYTSYGRRDPFIPIELPEVDGISIDQVRLTGIIWSASDPIAILEDVRDPNVSYSLRTGDQVVNGTVVKIGPKEVVFSLTEFGVTRRFSMVLPEIQESK
jgi:hypothetical protein